MKELKELSKLIRKLEITKEEINPWIINKGFSSHDFNRKFKSRYKLTPQKLWNKVRLKKAIKNYHQTWSVNKVSDLCFYKNNNEFYMEYKRKYHRPWNTRREKTKQVVKKIIIILLIVWVIRLGYLNSPLCQEYVLRTTEPGILWKGRTTIEIKRECG